MAQLYFYYSTMNAGKSTTLLQSAFNYQERGMDPLIFTAAIDDRFGSGKVSSRIGLAAPAHLFDEQTDLLQQIVRLHGERRCHCVLVDEAQFLRKEQVQQLTAVVDTLDIPVLCYGLRTDFLGALFPGSARLLAIADVLEEIKSVCACGAKATMNLRVDDQGRALAKGAQTQIGGNERYVALCRKHFNAALAGSGGGD